MAYRTNLEAVVRVLRAADDFISARDISIKAKLGRKQVHPVMHVLNPVLIKRGSVLDRQYKLKDIGKRAVDVLSERGLRVTSRNLFEATSENNMEMAKVEEPVIEKVERDLPEWSADVEQAAEALGKLAKKHEQYRQALLRIRAVIDEALS